MVNLILRYHIISVPVGFKRHLPLPLSNKVIYKNESTVKN